MEEIISVTIDGDTYRKMKETYEAVNNKRYAIKFGGGILYDYRWDFFTESEAIRKIRQECEFIVRRNERQIYARELDLNREIEKLKKENESLRNKL